MYENKLYLIKIHFTNVMFQLKYFEPVWGENKSVNSNTPLSEWSNVKHKKPKPITVPVSNSTITTDVTLNATATCSSSDDINKNEDIQLELPWDSVDSTTDLAMTPLMEEVILPSVNNLFILFYSII